MLPPNGREGTKDDTKSMCHKDHGVRELKMKNVVVVVVDVFDCSCCCEG